MNKKDRKIKDAIDKLRKYGDMSIFKEKVESTAKQLKEYIMNCKGEVIKMEIPITVIVEKLAKLNKINKHYNGFKILSYDLLGVEGEPLKIKIEAINILGYKNHTIFKTYTLNQIYNDLEIHDIYMELEEEMKAIGGIR